MILARSPYFVNCPATEVTSGTPAYATLAIAFNRGSGGAGGVATYNLRKNLTGTPSTALFEIGELIRDVLYNDFDGDYYSNATWVEITKRYYDSSDVLLSTATGTTVVIEDIAVNGFSYFQDGSNYNPFPNAGVSITNRLVYCLKNQLPNIPVYGYNTSFDYSFVKDGDVISSGSVTPLGGISQDSELAITYLTQDGIVTYDNFRERVEDDGGTFENSFCLTDFFNTFNVFDADEVIIEYANAQPTDRIQIRYFEECKYTPYKIVFTNRFGAEQDFYMTKKSVENLNIEDETFKFNTISATGTYDVNEAQYTRYSVAGRESITLNSPFLPEEYNEVVKELMLTENAWLVNTETNETTPVIPKTKSLTYKTSVNDKLTQYTIEFDYAYDAINTVR